MARKTVVLPMKTAFSEGVRPVPLSGATYGPAIRPYHLKTSSKSG
jgi:hypothetical protein